MDVAGLVAEIEALFPKAFLNDLARTAWTNQYQAILGHYSGPQLAGAFRATLSTWDKERAGFPKPADILKHCRGVAALTSADEGFHEYRPIPKEELVHCSRKAIEAELREAKFKAGYYAMWPDRWTRRQDGSAGHQFGDLARRWANRVGYIERMLTGGRQAAE